MGRADDCEIVLSDVGVSRRHARFVVSGGEVRVEDTGSGNGTFVRGKRVDREVLRDGDEVVIDPFLIEVRIPATRASVSTGTGRVRARLDVVTGPALARSSYPIPARGLTIGRSDTRDVIIPDPAGSRHHCSIFLQSGVHVLRDMGSANGVFVNDQRVTECTLSDGDIITIGNTELRYASDQPGAVPHTPVSRGNSDWMSWVMVGATVFIVFLLALIAVTAVFLFQGDPVPRPTTRPSGPPAWELTLTEAPTTEDPAELSRRGVEMVRNQDDRGALEQFWLLLRARPGYESAEVFAYAAGEHVVLDTMQPRLLETEARRAEHEQTRDELLQSNSRSSRRTLESDYADDPVVREALGLGPSEAYQALEAQLTAATELAAGRGCADAIEQFDAVLASTRDDSQRQRANSGRVLCARELAREVHSDWSRGVRAQSEGDVETARAAFEAVLERDPHNPSARFRLDRLP